MTTEEGMAKAATEETKVDPEVKADQVEGDPKNESESKPEVSASDKRLQKLEMQTANANRLLTQLLEKQEKGEELTAKEVKRLEKTRAFLTKTDDVTNEDVRNVAAEAVESADQTETRLAKLEKELAEEREAGKTARAELNWSKVKAKFHGLDCDSIFDKATTDAMEILGDAGTPDSISKLASRLFDDRAEAAFKRKNGKEPEKEKEKLDITPGAGKVSGGSGKQPVQLSERDQILQDAKACIVVT